MRLLILFRSPALALCESAPFMSSTLLPLDLSVCDNGTSSFAYNLLLNNASALGVNPLDFALVYYGSQSDLDAGTAIPSNQLNNFVFPKDSNNLEIDKEYNIYRHKKIEI